MGLSRRIRRNELKGFYNKRKKEDRAIGLKINSLTQELLFEIKKAIEKDDKSEDTKKYITNLVKEIKGLREVGRLKNEFPSLSSLSKYLKKEGITLAEIKESVKS